MIPKILKKHTPIQIPFPILIIADTHNTLTEEEVIKLRNTDYQACFLLGDVGIKDLRLLRMYISFENTYGILGNHDDFTLLDQFNVPNIHGKKVVIKGISFIGWEGSSKYKNEEYPSFTQKESVIFSRTLQECNVLLTHDSPYHLYSHDCAHEGLKGISLYLKKNPNTINIHGHHHIHSELLYKKTNKIYAAYKCDLLSDTQWINIF